MVDIFQKKVLMLACYAGEIMMKNGAEIYRVEDTITRICRACHMDNIEVFATSMGIFVSLDKGGKDDDPLTYLKRIKGIDTNLEKISMINHFSREFTTTDLSVEDGMKMLDEINMSKSYPYLARLLGAAFISSFFCLIFGGSVMDFLSAFITGIIAYMFSGFLQKYETNFFIRGFCSCALATFIAILISSSVPNTSYEPIIIGSIMIFVPGVAITNSIRDFLSGDMLSGIARMTEALLTAVALAAGTGVILNLWSVIGGLIA